MNEELCIFNERGMKEFFANIEMEEKGLKKTFEVDEQFPRQERFEGARTRKVRGSGGMMMVLLDMPIQKGLQPVRLGGRLAQYALPTLVLRRPHIIVSHEFYRQICHQSDRLL